MERGLSEGVEHPSKVDAFRAALSEMVEVELH